MPAGTASANEYVLVVYSGERRKTPSLPVESTAIRTARLSAPRRTVAVTVSPRTSARYFRESCTNGVSTLSRRAMMSPRISPAAWLGEPAMTESMVKGTARSKRSGLLRTSPIMEWSMTMLTVSPSLSTWTTPTSRRARSAWSMKKLSGT